MSSNALPYSSVRIATKSGPLAQIWLAANMSNLPKIAVLQTSIQESAEEIAKASGCAQETDGDVGRLEHITLHTSGDLLQGIVRVYSKQAAFLLTDIKDTLMKITTLFKANQRINVTIGKSNTITSIEQLILQDSVTEREVLSVPSLDFLQEDQSSRNLLDDDNSMRRKVQGAAPWDTSLEIGRRFGGDDDLDLQHTSALDLDFDFEDGQAASASKTWEEGTRQTTLDEGSTGQSQVEQVPLIEDDDFPLDDPNNGQWDLEISDAGGRDDHGKSSSNMSVELGRRADNASMIDETDDIAIDLGIEKELAIDEPTPEEETVRKLKAPRRSKQNSELANARVIDLDNEIEIKDPQPRYTPAINTENEHLEERDADWTKKRLLDELRLSINYLPSGVLAEVMAFQESKRQRLNPPDESELLVEPDMDISLSLDDNLISRDDINNDGAWDTEDSDHSMPIAADIGPAPIEEDYPKRTEEASSQPEESTQTQAQEVRLSSGETAPKTTVHMAELIRREFDDSDSLNFDNLLAAKHKADSAVASKDITKEEASVAFFDLLSLANEDCVDLVQQTLFESITINTKPDLFTKFITAQA